MDSHLPPWWTVQSLVSLTVNDTRKLTFRNIVGFSTANLVDRTVILKKSVEKGELNLYILSSVAHLLISTYIMLYSITYFSKKVA